MTRIILVTTLAMMLSGALITHKMGRPRFGEQSEFVFGAGRRTYPVHQQYFGYLRRNPNDAPDSDFSGYNFWLGKLNQFGGNYQAAEMVKAFIVSGEYRQRFGP